jgi:pimeloyl-ACP methyl ester carboxylesterase
MKTKTVLFIHGMFMTYRCWDQWVSRFQAQGYTCIALPWPGRGEPVTVLKNKHPDPQLGRLTLAEVIEHHVNTIRSLDDKPILIGHSMGGLITQILAQRELAAAGVAIDSGPPLGVLTAQWSFYKVNLPVINPLIPGHEPYYMPFEAFQAAFVNGMPLAEQRAAYDGQAVPESRLVGRGALSDIARIDFKKPHPPLLFIAGGADAIIPASLNKSNYEKYKASPSVTHFKEFPGRTHFLLGQQGWEEIADFVLSWLDKRNREGG